MGYYRSLFWLEFFTFAILLIVSSGPAYCGSIDGYIRDAKTHKPLPGASVIVVNTLLGDATDIAGYYLINDISPGTYSLQSSLIGYVSKTVDSVVVNNTEVTHINFKLKAKIIDTSLMKPYVDPKIMNRYKEAMYGECNLEDSSYAIPDGQKIIFEICHENYARSDQARGFYIGADGNIFSYKTSGDGWQVVDDSAYAERSLMKRYADSQCRGSKIAHNELIKMASLIPIAVYGGLWEPKSSCRDVGRFYFIAYDFDPKVKLYKAELLYMAGDSAQRPDNECALKLTKWLCKVIYDSPDILCGYPED